MRPPSIANEVLDRSGNSECFSVLDVGGGNGALASFLPLSCRYFLVDPTANGISGIDLPFPDESFDIVVSCHVLEHVPEQEREIFLDQLLAKTTKGLILLNPFYVPGTKERERLQLVIELTNADWAKEHLECSLPKIEDIEKYATERGIKLTIKPNGTMTTTLAFVFMDYFASKSNSRKEAQDVSSFFNEHYMEILDSSEHPNAYLIYLEKSA